MLQLRKGVVPMIHINANNFCILADAVNKLNEPEQASAVLKAYDILKKNETVAEVCNCEIQEVLGSEDSLIGRDHLKLSYQIETSTDHFIECIVTISLYDNNLYTFESILRLKF